MNCNNKKDQGTMGVRQKHKRVRFRNVCSELNGTISPTHSNVTMNLIIFIYECCHLIFFLILKKVLSQ